MSVLIIGYKRAYEIKGSLKKYRIQTKKYIPGNGWAKRFKSKSTMP